jgi:hypothetical protein
MDWLNNAVTAGFDESTPADAPVSDLGVMYELKSSHARNP